MREAARSLPFIVAGAALNLLLSALGVPWWLISGGALLILAGLLWQAHRG